MHQNMLLMLRSTHENGVQRLLACVGTPTQPVFGLRARRTDSLPAQESAPAPAAAPAAPQSRCSILAVVHKLRLRLRLMQLLIAISFVDARVGLGHAHRLHACWVSLHYGIADATWILLGTLLPPLGTLSGCNKAAFCIAPASNIRKGSESIWTGPAPLLLLFHFVRHDPGPQMFMLKSILCFQARGQCFKSNLRARRVTQAQALAQHESQRPTAIPIATSPQVWQAPRHASITA